jgi:integrase
VSFPERNGELEDERVVGAEHRHERVLDLLALAAGRKPRASRHTFASWAIRDGVSLLYLSRIMGTSVGQIDATYGHLVPDTDEYIRSLLDAGDERRRAAR